MQVDTFTPRVYRDNAFLTTGLAVDAGGREIRRFRDRRVAEGTLTSEIDAALGVLRDPPRRLVHELFALWRADGSAPRELVANHDRAVEAHRTALDLELDGGTPAARDDAWRRALTMWAALLDEPAMWDRLEARVADIDDPQLTLDDIDVLRDCLPDLLLDINAQLAADGHDPARQRALMGEFAMQARLGPERVEAALERTVAGVVGRVGRDCDAALEEIQAGGSGLAALSRLDASVKPELATIRNVLGEQHPATVRTLDHAAETYRLCAVRHYNASDGTSGAGAIVPYLRTALELAVSPDRLSRIHADLDIVGRAAGTASSTRSGTGGDSNGDLFGGQRPALMSPIDGLKGLVRVACYSTAALIATITLNGTKWVPAVLIIAIGAACGYLLPAMRPVPVLRALTFITIGLAAIATGIWWWDRPWVAVPGGVMLWLASSAMHTALRGRPAAQGWFSAITGVLMVIVGSLPWGGLWLGDGELWGAGHVGLWLVGFGHVYLVGAATGLGAARNRVDELTATLAAESALYMGAVWLWGGGGWPAFAAAFVLGIVTVAVLSGATREESAGLLALGSFLVPAAVLVVAGINSIGVIPTVLITVGVLGAGLWLITRMKS